MPVADASRWRFVATDMNGSTLPAGAGPVLNASQKQFNWHLGAARQCQFTIDISNPRADYLLANNALIKVYRKNRQGAWARMMVGDVIHAEESGQGDTGLLTVVAADPYWRLQRRLLGMGVDSAGRGIGYTDGSAGATIDNSLIISHILTNLNSVFWTGIQLGTVQNCGTLGFIGPVYAQNVGDIFQQICNTLGGPNLEFVPLEPSGSMPGTTICQLNIWAALGQSRPNALFEYGTGKRNATTYDRILSKDGLCNLAYSPPQGFPSVPAGGDTMIVGQDTASQSAIGLYQDTVQGDLTTRTLRQVLANEYVTVRKQARQQITLTPSVDNPLDFTVDYNLGDTVTVRAFVSGRYRFNGTARIYGVDVTIDEQDAETIALTFIPGG